MSITAGTVVVGVDDSPASSLALAWATEQALAERRPLTLVHAVRDVHPAYLYATAVYPTDGGDTLRAEGERILAAARAEVETRAPHVEVRSEFRLADPREVLLEMSRDAAMLVLGSRGRGQLRSLLLGSVSVAVVRHAECPVVVHRPGKPAGVHQGIVVGADGTEASRTVLEFAYREASLRDLPLMVLHCFWDVQAATAAAHLVPEQTADLDAERLALAESIAGMGQKYPEVRVTTELARGLPQEMLVRLSERMNLIVVGAHREGRLSQVLFGSVPISVVEHAHCPVAIVPLPDTD